MTLNTVASAVHQLTHQHSPTQSTHQNIRTHTVITLILFIDVSSGRGNPEMRTTHTRGAEDEGMVRHPAPARANFRADVPKSDVIR